MLKKYEIMNIWCWHLGGSVCGMKASLPPLRSGPYHWSWFTILRNQAQKSVHFKIAPYKARLDEKERKIKQKDNNQTFISKEAQVETWKIKRTPHPHKHKEFKCQDMNKSTEIFSCMVTMDGHKFHFKSNQSNQKWSSTFSIDETLKKH